MKGRRRLLDDARVLETQVGHASSTVTSTSLAVTSDDTLARDIAEHGVVGTSFTVDMAPN